MKKSQNKRKNTNENKKEKENKNKATLEVNANAKAPLLTEKKEIAKSPPPSKIATKKILLGKIQQSLQEKTGQLPSLNDTIILTAQSYLSDFKLSSLQIEKIQLAASTAKMDPAQILDKAIEWATRFYQNKYAALDPLHPESGILKSSEGNINRPKAIDQFSAGSAYLRIQEFVNDLMKKNDLAKNKEDKVYINQTYLVKHQGSNRDAVKGYLHVHQDALAKHHKKHDLHPRHNIEVNVYFGKRETEK